MNEEELAKKYAMMSPAQLKAEMNEIKSIPGASTNIEALTRMSALITEYEKRGMDYGGSGQSRGNGQVAAQSSGPNYIRSLIGLAVMGVGIFLTMNNDGAIYYGAILVGLVMIVQGFFNES